MHETQKFVIISIIILVLLWINTNNVDNFSTHKFQDSTYAPLHITGINNTLKPIPLNEYANQVTYDLQNPFPSSFTGYNRTPWNPVSYRDKMEPDGNIIGVISYN